ncbi:19201_t:CDS:2, partial [Entrophospora sp. SA101]
MKSSYKIYNNQNVQRKVIIQFRVYICMSVYLVGQTWILNKVQGEGEFEIRSDDEYLHFSDYPEFAVNIKERNSNGTFGIKKTKELNDSSVEALKHEPILPILSPDKKEIILVTHDECIFYSNDGKRGVWARDGELPLKKKGNGRCIMVKAKTILKPGKNQEGYWKKQMRLTTVHGISEFQ